MKTPTTSRKALTNLDAILASLEELGLLDTDSSFEDFEAALVKAERDVAAAEKV